MFGIRQPLYAATIWDVDLKDWDYEPIITKSDEVDTFEVKATTSTTRGLARRNFKQCNGSKSRHK